MKPCPCMRPGDWKATVTLAITRLLCRTGPSVNLRAFQVKLKELFSTATVGDVDEFTADHAADSVQGERLLGGATTVSSVPVILFPQMRWNCVIPQEVSVHPHASLSP